VVAPDSYLYRRPQVERRSQLTGKHPPRWTTRGGWPYHQFCPGPRIILGGRGSETRVGGTRLPAAWGGMETPLV
jgi:hypothetical protein